MAAESNASSFFRREAGFPGAVASPPGSVNPRAISFHAGASPEMIPMGLAGGGYFGATVVNSANSSSMLTGGLGKVQAVAAAGGASSSGARILESVPGLKHDTGLAVEWSPEEQYKLEEGLVKFADEPNIMKYIKIAAMMRDKTVRDVALRCRWMARKRRKSEEHGSGKKFSSRKDKLVESSSKVNLTSALPVNMVGHTLMMQQMGHNKCMPCEGINGTTNHLLEQNGQAFSQITSNLSTYKLQDNIDLFCRTRSNITAILNDMREMPGIMSLMPPLPVSINEDLANSILPQTTQGLF